MPNLNTVLPDFYSAQRRLCKAGKKQSPANVLNNSARDYQPTCRIRAKIIPL